MTDPQAAYTAYRRLWAEGVAQVVLTATPWPERRPSGYRAKSPPGTDEEGDPQD